jgi:predicted 3-demethylubiquinone-9 3-methyltransferase (glyoxalase superfamily)
VSGQSRDIPFDGRRVVRCGFTSDRGGLELTHLTPCLWFDGNAEEAARFWCGLLPGSRITHVSHAPGDNPSTAEGAVLTVEFQLMGRPFMGLNGGPQFKFSEAVSLMVPCETQAEIDRLWAALIADGGQEIECGWLKDRFGMAWQIVPIRMMEILRAGEPEGRKRAFAAMMTMKKFDIAAIERAYAGEAATA